MSPKGGRREQPSTDGAQVLSGAGWLALSAGAVTAVLRPGAVEGAIAAAVALGGTVVAVAAAFHRDREARLAGLPRRRSPIAFPLGTLLLSGGAAGLLRPCFLSRDEARLFAESHTYAPLVAVALLLAGCVLLIDGIDRDAPSERPFRLPDPPTVGASLFFFHPLQPLLIVPALVVPSLWRWIPIARYLHESWKELDAEAAEARRARKAGPDAGYDWRPLAVLCSGAVFLALMEYFGHAPTLRKIVDHFDPIERLGPAETFWALVRESPFRRLIEFAWWSGWRVLGFFLLPALVIKLLLREKITDHGLQTRGFLDHAWIYVGFFAYVLVAVVVVSYEESFQTYYPFYKEASRSWFDFWTWELLYAAQFFSLEFFFRGFWLKACKSSMGSHAIYAMVVPYCMIHFGKPFPETIAAILAGVVLGTLALRTRSIWSGFLIHVSVAISMDIAALLQTTGLPERWWPAL